MALDGPLINHSNRLFLSDYTITGDVSPWESPRILPALFVGLFEHDKQFQNLKFVVRRPKNIQSSVLRSSNDKAAPCLAFT